MANFCEHCGSPVKPGHLYCESCGAPVANNQAKAQPGVNPSASQASQTIPPVQVIGDAGKNAVIRAWEDLSSDKANYGRIAVLALICCIPIVDLFALAYMVKWGAGATRGFDKKLPDQYFTDFALGFFLFVVGLVWALVSCVLAQVPLAGVVAAAFLSPLACLCMLRVVMFGTLGSGFELTKVWGLYREKLGEIAFAFWIPMLIALVAFFGLSLAASLFGGISMVSLSGHSVILSGIGILGLLITLAFTYIGIVVSVAAGMVTYRATGYVIAENASDWVRESMVAKPTL